MSKTKKDLENVAKREARFSTLAMEERKGAQERAKREAKEGMKESAKDSRWETKVDNEFAKIRKKKVQTIKRKLKREE